MITYKYKLYRSKRNRHLDGMLAEACFVWNHCLALQRRYYAVYGKYASANDMKTHFAKRYKMQRLHSQSVQEVIERLDLAYQRFFKHLSKRPPKFKRREDMTSVVFKQGGFKVKGNALTVETNIFDFDQDIYGLDIKVSFVRKIRDEVRFSSLLKLYPDTAQELLDKTEEFAKIRLETYKRLAGK